MPMKKKKQPGAEIQAWLRANVTGKGVWEWYVRSREQERKLERLRLWEQARQRDDKDRR